MKSLSLYQIDEEIQEVLEYVINPETGELNPTAEMELESLNKEKLQKIQNIGLYFKNLAAFQNELRAEQQRLAALRRRTERQMRWLKEYLAAHLDEPIKTAQVSISFRKSESVEIDESRLGNLARDYPQCVKTEIKPIKAEFKRLLKASGVGIDGVRLIEKRNIIIK